MHDDYSEFIRLWTRCQPEVRRYVFILVPRPADAEDILQDTLTTLWEKFKDYDPERPFFAWAVGFAHLEVLKWRQRQSRDRLIFSDALLDSLEKTISEESPLLELRRHALDRCLGQLDERGRKLLPERYGRHGAIKELALKEGVSVDRLYYAISKLRGLLLACIDKTMRKEGWQYG